MNYFGKLLTLLSVFDHQEKINPKELETDALPLMDWFYNFAFYSAADKSSAKKLIKRTYFKALEYFDKTRGGADYKTWMLRVLLNRIYEFYSKEREIQKNELDSENLFFVTALSENELSEINQSIIGSVERKKILEILKRIPIDLRLPLIFQVVLKYNYELAAEYIDIPVGTIASRIFRARKWIFNELITGNKINESQPKLDYKEMKFISAEADGEKLEKGILSLENFSNELIIQQIIKKILEIHLNPVEAPEGIKSKLKRKIKNLIKKGERNIRK